ncbi:galactonate dehydratase [Micromonospora sp. 067-2]|uniref:galactonate dehydratase n=1 Tax=Micromonospora sp. 067-2 TaxID=2789270 RepID=UPI00397CAF92
MKITDIDTFQVAPRWCFVRVGTDEGLVGWGEPVVEGRAATVATAVGELADHLIGADPMRIEDHWQVGVKGGFYRGGPVLASAVAGLDQALWDIAGKALGVPVWQLLGGRVRDRIRVYSWIGGDSPTDVAEHARQRVAQGYTAVKMNGSGPLRILDTPAMVHTIVERVAAVREAVGPEIDIAVDFHGRFTLPMARRVLPLLDEYLLLFVEEPVAPEHSSYLGELARLVSTPLATGERLYSRWDFKDVIGHGIGVAQPDLSHAGGISEVRRIAAMAETYDVALAPHCPLGPLALAASLQVGFAAPNLLIQEQSLGIHYNESADLHDYLVDASVFSYQDGWVDLLTAPGLGIEVDEPAIRRAAQLGHRWRNPIWRRDDGSFTEW